MGGGGGGGGGDGVLNFLWDCMFSEIFPRPLLDILCQFLGSLPRSISCLDQPLRNLFHYFEMIVYPQANYDFKMWRLEFKLCSSLTGVVKTRFYLEWNELVPSTRTTDIDPISIGGSNLQGLVIGEEEEEYIQISNSNRTSVRTFKIPTHFSIHFQIRNVERVKNMLEITLWCIIPMCGSSQPIMMIGGEPTFVNDNVTLVIDDDGSPNNTYQFKLAPPPSLPISFPYHSQLFFP